MSSSPQSPQSSCVSSIPTWSGNTLRDQILLCPHDYIGSVEKRTQKLWVRKGAYMEEREVTYVPGLLKIFDEILVYAADNKQRDSCMDTLRVDVDVDVVMCRISVFNGGMSIPIGVQRWEEGAYVPEVIFGHLSNCANEAKEEITGVKLANIFSTEFVVETADGPGQKKYKQVFSENMRKKLEPEITGYRKGVDWTRVTFKPDLAKFNMTYLEEDTVALMRKRVFDMTGILGGSVQVVFNGKEIHLRRGFIDYVYQYVKPDYYKECVMPEFPWYFQKVDQWEVGVSLSGGQFLQVSFVNKVATVSGGTHVDYVSNLVVARALSYIKDTAQLPKIQERDVKRHLMVFINVHMENPTFSSPTKEALITPQEDFGSELELSDEFLSEVAVCLYRKVISILYGRKKKVHLSAQAKNVQSYDQPKKICSTS